MLRFLVTYTASGKLPTRQIRTKLKVKTHCEGEGNGFEHVQFYVIDIHCYKLFLIFKSVRKINYYYL